MKCRMKLHWINAVCMNGQSFPNLDNKAVIITELERARDYEKHLKVKLETPLQFKSYSDVGAKKIYWVSAGWFKEFNV